MSAVSNVKAIKQLGGKLLRSRLSPRQFLMIRRMFECSAVLASGNLNWLATVYGTDKWGSHWYTQHYQRYFAAWRKRRLTLLEIGVGGLDNPCIGGAESLRMWKRFFPNGHIVGIDLYDKSCLSRRRMDVLQCDQTDAAKLTSIAQHYGGFDIIIDDGSHRNEHMIETFRTLFPFLRVPGFYCIEDLQTSYWSDWGAIPGKTAMDFLRTLTDCVNYAERHQYQPSYYDRHITEIAFFHNLCVIRKELNAEKSNIPELWKSAEVAA